MTVELTGDELFINCPFSRQGGSLIYMSRTIDDIITMRYDARIAEEAMSQAITNRGRGLSKWGKKQEQMGIEVRTNDKPGTDRRGISQHESVV